MTDTASAANSSQTYSAIAKLLHWVIVILIGLLLYAGWTAEDLPREQRLGVMQTHAGLGLTVLVLMVSRLFWRLGHPAPALPAGMPRWQVIASKATHHGLYFFVILQPLLGLAITTTSKFNLKAFGVLGLQIAPNETIHGIGETLHGINAWVIAALIALHVAAALYHHFMRRDDVLKRMLPFAKI
ncbi:MAG TPA: cytochrome b [Parvibaculum sp.]|uniref:cytochrome b n=1 Tax=Parvibaculum sp. TaxID=2024848 RepID=UPI002CC457B1|nr:cytochrome b [Parvibaculum sp.]HMM13693.1 cytochrome b [Parvibaculum sp.]